MAGNHARVARARGRPMIHGQAPLRVIRRTVDRDASSDDELRELYTAHRQTIERGRLLHGAFVVLGDAVYDRATGARWEVEDQ